MASYKRLSYSLVALACAGAGGFFYCAGDSTPGEPTTTTSTEVPMAAPVQPFAGLPTPPPAARPVREVTPCNLERFEAPRTFHVQPFRGLPEDPSPTPPARPVPEISKLDDPVILPCPEYHPIQ